MKTEKTLKTPKTSKTKSTKLEEPESMSFLPDTIPNSSQPTEPNSIPESSSLFPNKCSPIMEYHPEDFPPLPQESKKLFVIYSKKLAGYLLFNYCTLVKVVPNIQDRTRKVYLFKNNDRLLELIDSFKSNPPLTLTERKEQ
jgi:hypothetical protein